jgi:hypothetical protein
MISKKYVNEKTFDFCSLATEKLKRLAKEHNRKEFEIGETRKLFSQFRLNKDRIDSLLLHLESNGHIRFKRRMKRIELVWQ